MSQYPGTSAAIYLATMPDVIFEGSNVHIVSTSGRESFEKVMRRSTWRRFLEREIRHLNEHEAAEQGRVVPAEQVSDRRRRKREPAAQRTCPD